jgi:hypothetical protein
MILKHCALVKMLIYYSIMCMLPFYPHLMVLFMFATCNIVDIFISLFNLLNVVPPFALHHLLFCSSYPCRIVFDVPLVSCINWILLYCIQFIEVRCCVFITYYFVMYRLLGWCILWCVRSATCSLYRGYIDSHRNRDTLNSLCQK